MGRTYRRVTKKQRRKFRQQREKRKGYDFNRPEKSKVEDKNRESELQDID